MIWLPSSWVRYVLVAVESLHFRRAVRQVVVAANSRLLPQRLRNFAGTHEMQEVTGNLWQAGKYPATSDIPVGRRASPLTDFRAK